MSEIFKKEKLVKTRLNDLNAKQQLYAGVAFISVKKLLEVSQVICVKELVNNAPIISFIYLKNDCFCIIVRSRFRVGVKTLIKHTLIGLKLNVLLASSFCCIPSSHNCLLPCRDPLSCKACNLQDLD